MIQANGKGMCQRERHFSSGNGALLVIVDSGGDYWDRYIINDTMLVALEHYGMPYRLFDLASHRLSGADLFNCAGIVLAQEHVGGSLSDVEAALVADAVKNGVGLVNFDSDLEQLPPSLLEIFGFSHINPNPFATDTLRITNNEHYITKLQFAGEYHTFQRMVTGTIVEHWGEEVLPLAEGILGKDQLVYIRHLSPWSAYEPRNYPVLFATRSGKGKAVQFTLNTRIWRREFFGHARGMDDLFWRSILWTVRKPFAANIIPPFVTLSIDDCSGRHNFAYIDVANEYGWVPLISLFLRTVPERLYPKIRHVVESAKAQFSTHALDYNTLLAFNFGKGECTREELDERFAYDDAWWNKVAVRPGATIRFHWGECGVNALRYCKERGRIFFCPALQTGLRKADMCMLDGFWPFNLQSCYYDYLPDDHDFFGFAAFKDRHREDFLIGCTPNLRESEHTNLEKAAQNAGLQIAHGLRGCFHAEIVTHEQKLGVLALSEWEQILKGTERLTKAYEKIFASHDRIAQYLKGKDGVWIEDASVKSKQIQCKLTGETHELLKISVFHDQDDSVSREYQDVNPFAGRAEVG
jgi:hypothetical protein